MSLSAKVNLLNYTRHQLREYFCDLGEKPFRSTQVTQWIHQWGVNRFDAMTNLGKELRERLGVLAEIKTPEIIHTQISQDGTRKWLLRLDDGNCIESVFIPEEDRGTLCISSQVGCALNCTFCSTARQGYNRNLSVAEIIAQVWIATQELKSGELQTGDSQQSQDHGRVISNVVFMGMGEPLLNFDNVTQAIEILLDDFAYGLSKRRVTLSTAGVIPAIDRLNEVCDVSLAVSLHAPNDELRNKLVPINKKYPLNQLRKVCQRYVSGHPRRKVTFEYVMLAGINDSLSHARELVRLLQGVPAKVNLIPFNPFPGTSYQTSSEEAINQFRDVLIRSGVVTVTRKTRGDDIDAACGQLVGNFVDRTRRRENNYPVNIISC